MNRSGKNAGYLTAALIGVWYWTGVSVFWLASALVALAVFTVLIAYRIDKKTKQKKAATDSITRARASQTNAGLFVNSSPEIKKESSLVAQARARLRETEALEQVERERLYGSEAQQNADYQISTLHKQATMLAEAGDLLAAVAALQTAQNMTLKASYSYSCLHFTRLPLFMQKAGLYTEALAEVERLAVFFKSYIARGFSHQPPKIIEELYQGYLADLYDKARLLSKRQKDLEQSKAFAILAAEALKLSRREQFLLPTPTGETLHPDINRRVPHTVVYEWHT